MTTAAWSPVGAVRCAFAESPRWDARSGRLLFVDMMGDAIHELDPATGEHVAYPTGRPLSTVIPRRERGVVVVVANGIAVLDEPGPIPDELVPIDVGPDATLNDACCDAEGRLWTASGAPGAAPPVGSIWRVNPSLEVTRHAKGVDHPNGLGFSPDGSILYHADSLKGVVETYVIEGDGLAGRSSMLASVDPSDGLPDGLAVDIEGGVWVALYDGAQVRRYSPDGSLDAVVEMPVPWTTSCCFGGPDLDQLFVSTGQDDASRAADDPIAGAILVVDPGIRGLPATPFGA
jgi:sugar lactone lactonase YvrE